MKTESGVATAGDRPRILLLTTGFTYPPTVGGRQRNNLLLRALQAVGEVDLVALSTSRPNEAEEHYMRENHGLRAVLHMPHYVDLVPWCWFRPLHPRLVRGIAESLSHRSRLYRPQLHLAKVIELLNAEKSYDIIVGRYLLSAMAAGLQKYSRNILDLDDVDTETYRLRLADPGFPAWRRWVLRRHLNQLVSVVRHSLPLFSALWVSNPSDRTLPGLERARVLCNLPFQAGAAEAIPPSRPSCKSKIAVVVSSWRHGPNIRGLKIFLAKVWPLIRRSCPDAVLWVVGSQMSDDLRDRLARIPGVEPVGFVDDLATIYRECAFAIAPVFSGGGTNIKVLEALWYGRACLVTETAYRGYQDTLPAGECLEVGGSLEALAAGAVRLYTDSEYRDRLGAAGQAAVREKYSFERFCAVVRETAEEVMMQQRSRLKR